MQVNGLRKIYQDAKHGTLMRSGLYAKLSAVLSAAGTRFCAAPSRSVAVGAGGSRLA